MAGSRSGGIVARDKILAKNPNHYSEIGRIGGANGHTGGFASEKIGKDGLTGKERAKVAGIKGGHLGKRGKAKYPTVKLTKKRYDELIKCWNATMQ